MDGQLAASSLGAVSWGRLQTLLEAAIIQADPAGAAHQAAAAAQERFVRLGRASEHGLKLIIARAAAGDAIWFKATIDRIAAILARQGDTHPVEVRRSKAIGILAQPAEALQLLCQHQTDDWESAAGPSDLALEPDEDQLEVPQSTGLDTTELAATVEPATSIAETAHRSLQITGPFHPDRARPRAVLYVHLSEEALTAGISVPTRVGRPGRPGSATADHMFGATTDTKPMPAGKSDNPNPRSGCGDHPTAASI